jgi:transposase
MNQLRALLLERGIVVPQGRAKLKYRVTELLVQPCDDLSPRIRILIEDMLPRWQALDDRIAAFDTEFAAEVKQNEAARRLTSIPGIGALNATALVAAVGDARTFARGRDLAAWLGLVPRQATTGGKPRLLGITKRGSKYLRKMLIQGARAALPTLSRGNTLLGQWLRGLLARAHSNTVVVALAANGLTVDRCSANLWRKMAPGCRPLYEDRNARISILANGIAERPDTFVQTVHASIAKPLADGAGHTFAPAAERCAFTCELSRLSS